MKSLEVYFRLDLAPYEGEYRYGVAFHRWVPKGRGDAITLSDNSHATIRVWFESQYSFGWSGHLIEYNPNSKGISLKHMGRQGSIYTGPLVGEVVLHNLTREQAKSLSLQDDTALEPERHCPEYLGVGRAFYGNLESWVLPFIDTLRFEYGQYWLKSFPRFDSRNQSLSHYCRGVGARWRLAGDELYSPFAPSEMGSQIVHVEARIGTNLTGPSCLENLSKGDWQRLGGERNPASLASQSASQAHEAVETGDFRIAFIEAALSLELALSSRFKAVSGSPHVRRLFDRESLSGKLVVLAHLIGIEAKLAERAVGALQTRNKVVHDGYVPKAKEAVGVYELLRIASAFEGERSWKYPGQLSSNRWGPVSFWTDEAAKRGEELKALGLPS